MKRLIMIAGMVLAFGLGSAAAFAATSDKPPSPPGQEECGHGNSQKPCKDDPQPDHGKDCDQHGNNGGVNEDHCKSETTPTETTPTETTTTETTDTTPTTPTTTPTTPNTPSNPTSSETPSSSSGSSSTTAPVQTTEPASPDTTESNAPQKPQSYTPPASPKPKPAKHNSAAVAAVGTSAAAPSTAAQQAPFTP
jgi:hypothetical protein